MKTTGIVREVDKLGRIVLPKETRRQLHMDTGKLVEIYIEEDKVILTKYTPDCCLCGSQERLVRQQDLWLCARCLNAFRAEEENE